jgi:hypothetical protein
MRTSIRRSSLVIALLACLITAACTPDFDAVTLVKDLRILAIRTTPPEILLPLGSTNFGPVHIDALVLDPSQPDEQFEWELWACSGEENRCTDAALQEKVATGKSKLDAIEFDFQITEAQYLAALKADIFQGFGGVPVILELRIDDPTGLTVFGIKRMVYGNYLPAEKLPNENPSFEQIKLDGEDNNVPAGQAIDIEACEALELLPVPSAEAKETYLAATFSDPLNGIELEEYLSYSFFSDQGGLSRPQTGGKGSPFVDIKSVDEPSSEWSRCLPSGLKPDPELSTIWVVIRDDRGGVNWQSLTINTLPAP